MRQDIHQKAADTLASEARLDAFAVLNGMTVEMARQLLERLLANPDMTDEARDYIFSSERSDEFRGYTAGEEAGYQRGHEAGFAKGACLVLLMAVAGLAGILLKAGR